MRFGLSPPHFGVLCGLQVKVSLPRFLDTSLINVDTHPTYITFVIKGKVLRLRFPEEVLSDCGSAQRSAATGELVITVPKARSSRTVFRPADADSSKVAAQSSSRVGAAASRTRKLEAPTKLGDVLMEEASKAVSTKGIVSGGEKDAFLIAARPQPDPPSGAVVVDDDDVPPLI
jgi:hypothetical protein